MSELILDPKLPIEDNMKSLIEVYKPKFLASKTNLSFIEYLEQLLSITLVGIEKSLIAQYFDDYPGE